MMMLRRQPKSLQSRKSCTHTSVICNVEVFVQGYIEVHANKCLFTGKIEFVNCLHNTLFLFKSVFKILLLERPQSYYLFRFLAIKSLFILGFWFLFCNFIGVTEIFAHHLQTTGVTFGSACLTNITTMQNEPMVGNRYEFFRNILLPILFPTLNG